MRNIQLKIKYNQVLLTIISLSLASCSTSEPINTPSVPTVTTDQISEEKEIYTRVIAETFGTQPIYVIENRAGCLITEIRKEGYEGYKRILTELGDDTLDDYVTKVDREIFLNEFFLGDEQFAVVDEKEYWLEVTPEVIPYCSGPGSLSVEKLQMDFPSANGVLHLSPIGFNEDENQALVCLGLNVGGCKKDVDIILLKKNVDNWVIDINFHITSMP